MKTQFDVAIVGGGLVGLATACALSRYDLTVAIIDTKVDEWQDFKFDDIGIRASAINSASQRYLCLFDLSR